MAPPVASFTVIPLADVDPDSPVTTDLMNALRLNDQNLFAQLVGDPVATPPFTPAAAHNHDGLNSAAVAGANLQFIAATEVSGAAVASVTFAGLDGDTDVFYVLYGTWIPGVAAPINDPQVRFNAGATGYDNSDDALTTGIWITGTLLGIGADEHLNFKMEIFAQNQIQGVDLLQAARSEAIVADPTPGASISRDDNAGARTGIALPAANITSLEIISPTAGLTIGIGSRFSLYKLSEN